MIRETKNIMMFWIYLTNKISFKLFKNCKILIKKIYFKLYMKSYDKKIPKNFKRRVIKKIIEKFIEIYNKNYSVFLLNGNRIILHEPLDDILMIVIYCFVQQRSTSWIFRNGQFLFGFFEYKFLRFYQRSTWNCIVHVRDFCLWKRKKIRWFDKN